jgi:uridine monophosphate synthetase
MLADIANSLRNIGAVKFGKFTLKSGQTSDVYYDMRCVVSYPSIMADVCVQLDKFLPVDRKGLVIAGVPVGGIPYASILSQVSGVPMIIVRDTKKDHGLQQSIEGVYDGKEVVLVEDVVSTGGSVLETIKILENEGVKVKKVLVVLDRLMGGVDTIRAKGCEVDAVLTTEELSSAWYIPCNQNPVSKRLIEIVKTKQTNLIASLDLTNPDYMLSVLAQIADQVCAVKVHYDILSMPSSFDKKRVGMELSDMAKRYNFLVIEDRKYADIPSISLKQYANIPLQSDVVTVHGICGEEVIKEFAKNGINVLLVHGMSSKGALTDSIYSAKIKDMGFRYPNVVGFVSQQRVSEKYLNFTPGVNLMSVTDGTGQTYRTIGDIDTDLFIVGRGIYESDDIVKSAREYKEQCYKKWVNR